MASAPFLEGDFSLAASDAPDHPTPCPSAGAGLFVYGAADEWRSLPPQSNGQKQNPTPPQSVWRAARASWGAKNTWIQWLFYYISVINFDKLNTDYYNRRISVQGEN